MATACEFSGKSIPHNTAHAQLMEADALCIIFKHAVLNL